MTSHSHHNGASVVIALALALAPGDGLAVATPPFTGTLEHGGHAVGFRLLMATDSSRPSLGGVEARVGGREMPISIWYPAEPSAQPALRLRDYVRVAGQSILGQGDAAAASEEFTARATSRGVPGELVERALAVRLAAIPDAPAARSRSPLVLFAHASPETQCVMAEYLASHGFVVAAIQSRGATGVTYRLSRENLDAMVADLSFVATRMKREGNVAAGPVGVIGMSNGAIAGLALQLRGLELAGVVSLDGGIGEDAGGAYLRERSGGDLSQMRAPVVHFYAPDNPHLNLSHLRSYHSSARTLIFVRGMRHTDFLANPVFDRIVPGFSGPASPDATPGAEWTNRYTLRFLRAVMNADASSADWLAARPESHGVPAGLLTIERWPAQ